ncbi:MAG TPA: trypsin-like peptidase domain-containing protein [Acetobacteraceae bacterium]|jgi:serine protease Do|nr:trypsin-like peptidase domain-containing protein [Acetobacteraceae bacterium]
MRRLLIRAAVAFLAAAAVPPTSADARSMASADAQIAQQATPAVVSISLWKVRDATKPGAAPRRVKVYGSGFIIDPSGIIVTNKHVIDGSINAQVVLSDGTPYPAKVLAAAAMVDIAVLKIEADHPLPFLKWGDSDALKVGDAVLTMGNGLAIGLSVSAGIVSALNRDLQDSPFDSYIQTDAAINHGNSGGPLVDESGDVIGIDTALYNPDQNGGFIGIGFAIPSSTAKFVVGTLLDPRHPKPGWLGFTLQDMTPELAQALGTSRRDGAIISAIDAGGPASKAGLRTGDVLQAINNERPADSRAFMRTIVMLPTDSQAKLTTWRDGKEQMVQAAIEEWPNLMPQGGMMTGHMAAMMAQKEPDPGVKLAPITDEVRKQYGLDSKLTGVLIASVEADTEASDLGLAPGDVITSIQGTPVATPDDVRHAIKAAHEQHRPYLAILIQSKNAARWVSISIGATTS